jgi:hypothetical protein
MIIRGLAGLLTPFLTRSAPTALRNVYSFCIQLDVTS